MPPNTVYVGRPSRWANPWRLKDCSSREACLELYRRMAKIWGEYAIDDLRRELRGKDLACWCPVDKPCHADLLLEIVNA